MTETDGDQGHVLICLGRARGCKQLEILRYGSGDYKRIGGWGCFEGLATIRLVGTANC